MSWFDWDLDERRQAMLAFTRRLIALRRQHPGLRRRDFFHGRSIRGVDARDIVWLHPGGREIADREWSAGSLRTFGLCVSGEQLEMLDEDGDPVTDDSLLILLSAHDQAVNFQLPMLDLGHWKGVVDTAAVAATGRTWRGGASYPLARRSLAILRGVREAEPRRRS